MPIGGDALIIAMQAPFIEDRTIMDNVTEHQKSPCYPASLQFLNQLSHKVGDLRVEGLIFTSPSQL